MTADIDPAVLTATRESLHRVAEHLLAATHKRATGQITLQPAPGGFRTPQLPDGSRLGVDGADLVVTGPAAERREPLTTLAQAAAFAGVPAGFPWTKHPPATPFEPDAPLDRRPGGRRRAGRLVPAGPAGAHDAGRRAGGRVAQRARAVPRALRPRASPPARSTTASRRATRRSPRRTCTSARTSSRRAASSGTPRSAPTGPGTTCATPRPRWTSSAAGTTPSHGRR